MKVMSIDLGLSKRSGKEEQMSEEEKLVGAIHGKLGLPRRPDEECCSEGRTLIPVQAQALLKKILSAQFKLDALLGPRGDHARGKALKIPPVKETSLLLQAAHTEMNTLLTRLTRLVEWFV